MICLNVLWFYNYVKNFGKMIMMMFLKWWKVVEQMIQDGKNVKYFGYSGFEDFFEWYIVFIVFKNIDKIFK